MKFRQHAHPAATMPELKSPDHPQTSPDYVMLLHGLGRTALSMKRLEWTLAAASYQVINLSYPSTRISVQEAADHWLAGVLNKHTPDRTVKIHFVTHSLGGIVLRQYLSSHEIENLGRVVMIAPPNHGSEVADKLKHRRFYQWLMGPAGQQLGTGPENRPGKLGPADFELGVIAGNRSLNPLFSSWIPGPDDGKVSVRSTQLEGMRDFLVVRRTHTWMVWHKEVALAVRQFLEKGRFEPARSLRM